MTVNQFEPGKFYRFRSPELFACRKKNVETNERPTGDGVVMERHDGTIEVWSDTPERPNAWEEITPLKWAQETQGA